MPTDGFIPGRLIRVMINEDKVYHSTICAIQVETQTGEVETKDTVNGTRTIIPKTIGGQLTVGALTRYDNPADYISMAELFPYWNGRTEVNFLMASENPADFAIEGKGYITDITNDADVSAEGSEIDIVLQITGDIIGGIPLQCVTETAGNTSMKVCFTGEEYSGGITLIDNGAGSYTLTMPGGIELQRIEWYVNNLSGNDIGDLFLKIDNTANTEDPLFTGFRVREEITGGFVDTNSYGIFWRQTQNGDGTTDYIWTGMQAFGGIGMTIFLP